MTNEEAIEILEDDIEICTIQQKEALDMAIEALEQEPCEDCISREAAIDALRDAENHAFNSYYKGLIAAHKIIANLPSVTPKFTNTEIQKMQELEQAQLEKAYELGRAEVQPCEDTISKKDVMAIIEWAYDECKIDGYTDYCEIRDMVKELPSVTPQESEDYISRQEVIDIINFEDKWLHDANGHNANTKIAFSGLRSRVKALLSVTSEAESEAK